MLGGNLLETLFLKTQLLGSNLRSDEEHYTKVSVSFCLLGSTASAFQRLVHACLLHLVVSLGRAELGKVFILVGEIVLPYLDAYIAIYIEVGYRLVDAGHAGTHIEGDLLLCGYALLELAGATGNIALILVDFGCPLQLLQKDLHILWNAFALTCCQEGGNEVRVNALQFFYLAFIRRTAPSSASVLHGPAFARSVA